jgi:hypothetical protein
MNRIQSPRLSLALSLLLALAPGAVLAESSVWVDCSFASNNCSASVDSPSSPGPFRYWWMFDSSGTDAVFPQDCTYLESCRFWCPRNPGPISVTLQVYDANWQLIGTASSAGMCTQQDIILPY